MEYDVPVRVRDGVVLRADIYRPTDGGPYSTLIVRTPYSKSYEQLIGYAHPTWYARQGFVVMV